MAKTTFKAPVEHSILLACFVLVWLGPAFKLAGLLTCSWWGAFIVHLGLWALATVLFVTDALVKQVVKFCLRYAHQL